MTKRYVIAYHPEDLRYWKFLCFDDGKEIKVVYDFNKIRGNQYVDCMVTSKHYIIRDATQEEIDEVVINKL